jgi:hypothetical protein
MLSNDNDFSIKYAEKYSIDFSLPNSTEIKIPNKHAIIIQTNVQINASFDEMICCFLLKTPRSNNNIIVITIPKTINIGSSFAK